MIKTKMAINPEVKILELKMKILREDYIQMAISEIATLLTDSIKKRNFYLNERKQQQS